MDDCTRHGQVCNRGRALSGPRLPHTLLVGHEHAGVLRSLPIPTELGLLLARMSHVPTFRCPPQHVKIMLKIVQDYFWSSLSLNISCQLRHFRLLSFPMLKSSTRELVDHMYETGSKEENMQWSARQWKTLQIRRMAQLMTHTADFRPFVASPAFSRMMETFEAQDAYGAAVHMDQFHFHVFLIGTAKKLEYLRVPSHDLRGIQIRDLVKYVKTARGHPKDGHAGDPSRRIQISASLYSDAEDQDKDMVHVLRVLWQVLVEPIVRALKLESSTLRRKRVIWCPTGTLATLPFHAAGIYDGPIACRDNIFNYAVSSYTPTFTAFCRAVDQTFGARMQPQSVLIIADETNAGNYPGLPNVAIEADIIKQFIPSDLIMDPTDKVSTPSVGLAGTIASRVELLHFACHGRQHPSDPLLSGLELRAGCLTLDQLTKIAFPNGRLAYLSACETASIDSVCPDSGMNLATTFLFNGFRSVIGSMWSMQDIDGPFIAQRVYERICENGTIDYSEVPFALDEAVRGLRESGVPASRWATFIHMGA